MNGAALSWRDVRAEALRRIRAGVWAPGARIPDETELATELGCARATVNRALRDLATEGLLERRRKGGTRVAETPVRRAVLDIPIIRRDIEARGLAHGYRLLDERRAPLPPVLAKSLALIAGAEWRHLLALHLADGKPFCLEDRWLAPDIAVGVDFTEISANEWLVRSIPWSGGQVAWQAVALDATEAGFLSAPPGAPALALDRVTLGDNGPITAVRLFYVPGHKMSAAL